MLAGLMEKYEERVKEGFFEGMKEPIIIGSKQELKMGVKVGDYTLGVVRDFLSVYKDNRVLVMYNTDLIGWEELEYKLDEWGIEVLFDWVDRV